MYSCLYTIENEGPVPEEAVALSSNVQQLPAGLALACCRSSPFSAWTARPQVTVNDRALRHGFLHHGVGSGGTAASAQLTREPQDEFDRTASHACDVGAWLTPFLTQSDRIILQCTVK